MIINSVVLFLTNAPDRIILIMNLSNPVQAEELFTTNQALYITELGAISMLLLNSAINSFISAALFIDKPFWKHLDVQNMALMSSVPKGPTLKQMPSRQEMKLKILSMKLSVEKNM